MRLLEATPLWRVLEDLSFTCLDVGARSGFALDLLPIARSVDAVGFEPDPDECNSLNKQANRSRHPWRSLRYLPVAVGLDDPDRVLNLYSQRGCSSLLEADIALSAQFSRDDYYQLEGTVSLPTVSLDKVASEHGLTDAVFLKLDVQGVEIEVLESSRALLERSLLAIRSEVSFLPIYKNQPLFGDVAAFLREYAYQPMGFEELHHWRRTTKVKHPRLAPGPIPYSRGQIVHGDMVFFRDPATLADDTPTAIELLLKAAFLALVYDYVDYATAILDRPMVANFLHDRYRLNISAALGQISRRLARRYRTNHRKQRLGDLLGTMKATLRP